MLKNWRKSTNKFLRAHNEKFGKPKHQTVKVHLFGGISRKGLLPLVIFKGIMYSRDFQNFLSYSVMPFIKKNAL